MWGGATVFAIALRQGSEYFISFRKEWLTAIFAMSVLMVAAGSYEIVSGMVWAGTYYSTGFSYRASGTLFNPNVLGLWCAMTVLLGSLCFHLGWISRRATFGAMLLAMCLLILSSSRSGFVLSIFNLGAVPMILFWRRKFIQKGRLDWIWPPAAFLLAFLVCLCLIEYAAPSRHAFMTTLYANLHRFLQLPEDVFWIFIMKVFTPGMKTLEPILVTAFEWLIARLPSTSFTNNLGDAFPSALGDFTKNVATAASSYEAGKVMESVKGRMLLEYISDNSFMSIYAVGGMWSLLIWLFLWAILFWTGIRNMQSRPGILSAHALAAVGFCFASGFFLRAPQLFPVWIFLSMVLGACLCWWSSPSLPSSLTGVGSGNVTKPG